jgi:hypothetical protein
LTLVQPETVIRCPFRKCRPRCHFWTYNAFVIS